MSSAPQVSGVQLSGPRSRQSSPVPYWCSDKRAGIFGITEGGAKGNACGYRNDAANMSFPVAISKSTTTRKTSSSRVPVMVSQEASSSSVARVACSDAHQFGSVRYHIMRSQPACWGRRCAAGSGIQRQLRPRAAEGRHRLCRSLMPSSAPVKPWRFGRSSPQVR